MDRALREQDQTGAPILIYVYTDWCPYCASFDRDVLADRSVGDFLTGQVVKMRINPETSPEGASLGQRLGVTGYPSFYLISPRRTVNKVGYESLPTEFLGRLQRAMSRQVDAACRSNGGQRR